MDAEKQKLTPEQLKDVTGGESAKAPGGRATPAHICISATTAGLSTVRVRRLIPARTAAAQTSDTTPEADAPPASAGKQTLRTRRAAAAGDRQFPCRSPGSPPAGLLLSAGGRRTLPLKTAPRRREKKVDLQAAL